MGWWMAFPPRPKGPSKGSRVLVDEMCGMGGGLATVKNATYLPDSSSTWTLPVEFDDEPGTWWIVPQSVCSPIKDDDVDSDASGHRTGNGEVDRGTPGGVSGGTESERGGSLTS